MVYSFLPMRNVAYGNSAETSWLTCYIETAQLTLEDNDFNNNKYIDIASADDLAYMLRSIYNNTNDYGYQQYELIANIDLYGKNWFLFHIFTVNLMEMGLLSEI